MPYTVEIFRRTVTPYDPGSGEWLDGDVHVLAEHETVTEEFDPEFDGEEGTVTPVQWAVDRIRRTDAIEASVSPIPDELPEHVWLLGTYDHPYTTDVEETTVRVTGDFTPTQRAEIFRTVILGRTPYGLASR